MKLTLPRAPRAYDETDQNNVRKLLELALNPMGESANVGSPTGGSVQDAEARAAIAGILTILQARGLMGSA